jgi:hypothetical protein
VCAALYQVAGHSKGGDQVALYYANGGPGPASRLVRLHYDGGVWPAWAFAPYEEWSEALDWHTPPSHVQAEILALGELVLIAAADVPKVQQEIRERYAYD